MCIYSRSIIRQLCIGNNVSDEISSLSQHQKWEGGLIFTVQPQWEVHLASACQLCTHGVKQAFYHHNLSDYTSIVKILKGRLDNNMHGSPCSRTQGSDLEQNGFVIINFCVSYLKVNKYWNAWGGLTGATRICDVAKSRCSAMPDRNLLLSSLIWIFSMDTVHAPWILGDFKLWGLKKVITNLLIFDCCSFNYAIMLLPLLLQRFNGPKL